MEENKKLRNRVEVLEKGLEEPKFSTPEGISRQTETTKKEAETTKKEAEATKAQAETTNKEAERPPQVSEDASTVMVMLKLMEGMRALQKQMLDGKDDEGTSEAVRQAPALPCLPEWSSTSGPIEDVSYRADDE